MKKIVLHFFSLFAVVLLASVSFSIMVSRPYAEFSVSNMLLFICASIIIPLCLVLLCWKCSILRGYLLIAVIIIVSLSAIQYYYSLVFTDTNISELYENEDSFFSTARMFIPLPEQLQDNSEMGYLHKRYNNGKEYICLTLSYESCEYSSAIKEQEITYNEHWLEYKSNPLFLIEPSEGFVIDDTLYDCFIVIYEGKYYSVAIGQNSTEHRITYLFVEDEYLSHTSPADLIPQYYP